MNLADMVVRSSLEEMLESLHRRDENPKDVPPALPSRPISRGRLPSARRSLTVNLKVENAVSGTLSRSQEKEGEENESVLDGGIVGNKRVAKVGQEESQYVKLPALESYEERSEEVDVFHSPASYSDPAAMFNEKLRSRENMNYVLTKIATLENATKNTIERIIWVQKQYRCLQAYRHFQKLKQAAIILQSFIRGYLARKNFCILKGNGRGKLYHEKINVEAHKILQECKVQALALAELQSRALQAEAMLSQKEAECAALREKLQLSDLRWLANDEEMKSKEEMWKKQITSLQLSLAASKTSQPCGRYDLPPPHHNHHNCDSEDDISTKMHTKDGTPPREFMASAASPSGEYEGKNDRVGSLAIELEQRMLAFEDNASRLIRQPNPEEEFRKLKARFNGWKKDFKARLRETKVALLKSGVSEGGKKRRRWWVKRAIQIL